MQSILFSLGHQQKKLPMIVKIQAALIKISVFLFPFCLDVDSVFSSLTILNLKWHKHRPVDRHNFMYAGAHYWLFYVSAATTKCWLLF